ncbi:MAG: helix-turn-helix domain-containing protein [Turicibacter sp.]
MLTITTKQTPIISEQIKQIREQRVFQHKTLQQLSKNICTASYLSRIEKGLVNPNPELIIKLREALNLSISNQIKTNHQPNWLTTFNAAILQHNEPLIHFLANSTQNLLSYQEHLLKFIQHTLDEQLVEATRLYELLYKLKAIFSRHELQAYEHFSGVYFMKLNQASQALTAYTRSLELSDNLKFDDPLLLLNLGLLHSQMGKDVLAIESISSALTLFTTHHYAKYKVDATLSLANIYTRHHLFEKADCLLTPLRDLLEYHDSYDQMPLLLESLGLLSYHNQSYKLAESYYKQSISLHSFPQSTYGHLVELYFHTHQVNKLQKLYTQLENLKFSTPSAATMKLKYYKFLSHYHPPELFRIFLQQEAIPYVKSAFIHDDFHLYMTSLSSYYEKKGKYKKAFTLLQQIKPF